MRFRLIPLVITAFLAPAASAQQDVDRVLHFTSTSSAQNLQEIATVIRSIAAVPQVALDESEKTLTLRGSAGQVTLAEWLFTELDRPISAQALQSQNWAKHEYRASDTADDVVRVFYLTNAPKPQSMPEIATVVRSTGDIRRLCIDNALKAITVRGTSDQANLTEFLLIELDRPVIAPGHAQKISASQEYRMAEPRENLVRVFYLPNIETMKDFQEAALLVRNVARLRRLFTYNGPRGVVVRGTDDQLALAAWLFTELNRTSAPQALAQDKRTPQEYRLSNASDDFVRVYYLAHIDTPKRLRETVMKVRSITNDPSIFTYSVPKALAIRGTAEQLAQADRVITEQDR
jgi:hypothetical protein